VNVGVETQLEDTGRDLTLNATCDADMTTAECAAEAGEIISSS